MGMTEADVIAHWRKRAKESLKVALLAVEAGSYGLALFHCHLAIEKALKALFMEEHRKEAPFTHDLAQLATMINREWTEEEKRQLARMTEYAVAARYDDPVWAEREATEETAREWIEKADALLSRLSP